VLVPDLGHQPLACEDASGVGCECNEEVVLLRPQVQLRTGQPHPARAYVDLEIGHLQPIVDDRRGLAELGAHPRQELGQPEGLGHVVDRTGVEPDHDVELFGPSRHSDDAEQWPQLDEAAAQLDAVGVREAEVEENEVGFFDVVSHHAHGVEA
jgi:hypothetical protein